MIGRSVSNDSRGVTRLLRRWSCQMARAGQHHAHHLLVDTDRCQRVETMIGYAGRQLIQYSAAIPGRRGSSRLRPVVRTATRRRVLMVRLVVRLLVEALVVGGVCQYNAVDRLYGREMALQHDCYSLRLQTQWSR